MRKLAPIVLALAVAAVCRAAENPFMTKLVTTEPRVLLSDGAVATDVKVEGAWAGGVYRSRVVNTSGSPRRIGEVVLLDFTHGLGPDTPIWGEGFTMLAQTIGTLGAPVDLGHYPDRTHYRIFEPEGMRTAYGMMLLEPAGGEALALAFTTSRRFVGRIGFDARRLRVSLDCEGLEIGAGEAWELEIFTALAGRDRNELLDAVARMIAANHPPRETKLPTGWCSWYCFGPGVTAERIDANLQAIARDLPELRYVQIDDGYQPLMGDWLDTGKAFGGDVQGVLKRIADRGFEPAIWVAPFIASPESKLFREHPEWFVKGPGGEPLRSDTVGFGGWRLGPWYCLDGTHPEAQRWLEELFRTMRRDWGCTYFKLDANYWGAIHGGTHYDPGATRVEAYRRGMEAIRRGAGDAFILGCNHPTWPSLGLVDGVRTSGDIGRRSDLFVNVARENLCRAWQNGRLWWVDPDCALLTGDLPRHEFVLHATSVWATGGMMLSGDDLSKLPPERLAMLRKLLPPTGRAMRFDDPTHTLGRLELDGKRMAIAVFNWSGEATRRGVDTGPGRITDFWTGETLEPAGGRITLDLPPRSARLLTVER